MLEQVSIMGCIWHFGETQGLPLLWTSEEESVWKSYKNKKKDLARENKEESVLSQLYLSAVIKITAFPPNIHTLGFLWYLEGKAEIEWYLSKALTVITNHKRSLLLIIICWDILKCTVFVIVATSRWRSGAGRRYTYTLTSTITLLLEHMFGGSSGLLLLLKPESESIWILKGNRGASNLTKAVRVHS